MQISIDAQRMQRDIRRNVAAFEAVSKTTDRVGYGAVMTGHRRGTDRERAQRKSDIRDIRAAGVRRAAPFAYRITTGWGVANFLASKGHDPFDYPEADVQFVSAAIEEEVAEAIEDAYRTGRPQTDRIRRVLKAAAHHLRDAAKEQISSGELGTNSPKYAERKKRMAKYTDIVTSRYGEEPPYGVKTGQFIDGLRFTFFAKRRPPRIAR